MRLATTLAALLLATGAHAATITIQPGPFAPLETAMDLTGLPPCGQDGTIGTNVGQFSASGRGPAPAATTSTCGSLTSAQVRSDNDHFGRTGWRINSNDMDAVTWALNPGTREAVFRLQDVGDIAGTTRFDVSVGDVTASIPGGQPNGAVNWVRVLFELTDPAAIRMAMIRPGNAGRDGWAIDNVSTAPVPLPAPILLLLAGMGGLGILGWRRRA